MEPLPRTLRRAARTGFQTVVDVRDALRFGRDPLVPPTRRMFDGPPNRAEFISNGDAFFQHYRRLLDLSPTDAVIDLGSGMGRKARPLTNYLVPPGRFDGLDPVKRGVEWCAAHFTSRYPNFRFHHLDIYNGHYNPTGTLKPSDVRLPFEDSTFDVAVLGSVFTHLLPDDVDHYLGELARVLKPGGRSLITYLLLNDETLALVDAGRAAWRFPYRYDTYAVEIADDPEDTVAHHEGHVLDLYRRHGFTLAGTPHYGSWSGRPDYLDFQDIVVAHRSAADARA